MSDQVPLDGRKKSPETHRVNQGGHPTGEKLVTGQPLEDPQGGTETRAEAEDRVQAEEDRHKKTVGRSEGSR